MKSYWVHTGIYLRVCEGGDARLVGGQSDLEGLIEVCTCETWSTVFWCDYVLEHQRS